MDVLDVPEPPDAEILANPRDVAGLGLLAIAGVVGLLAEQVRLPAAAGSHSESPSAACSSPRASLVLVPHGPRRRSATHVNHCTAPPGVRCSSRRDSSIVKPDPNASARAGAS